MTPRPLMALVLFSCNRDEADTAFVVEGPTLSHTSPTLDLVDGDSLELVVSASDSDGVTEVVVYHRAEGSSFWDVTALEGGTEGGDDWSGVLTELITPGVEYYFKATDGGETAGVSYLPEASADAPYGLSVRPASAALPFTEDFEPEEDESSLYAMGWWTPTEGFTSYPFELTTTQASSGSTSALHPRGIEDLEALSDWLISPPIDLSQTDTAMVRWSERGASTANLLEHGLYISTTSPLPEDGGFTAVEAALPAPDEGAWGDSEAYDLAAWVGEPVVYVGWYYRGQYSDDWYIDDVEVRDLVADIEASLVWSPDPVYPGEVAQLTVTLDNTMPVDAAGVSATLTLPEGGGELAEATVSAGDIAAEGSSTAFFELTLDADLADNRPLPLELTVTSGEESWDFDLEMFVGLPSSADLSLELTKDGAVSVVFGVGDPDAPTLTVPAWSGTLTAGPQTVTADLSEHWEYLPPGPGADRWFAEVTSEAEGTLSEFTITWGGEPETNAAASVLDETTLTYLPPPPEPTLVSVSPAALAPGASGERLIISLSNEGADTTGAVNATITSADADLVVVSDAEVQLDPDTWTAGELVQLADVRVDVSADHTDSTDLTLDILLSDDVESWELSAPVPVPWPVLDIVGVVIESDTSGDGVLDPGESARMELTVLNSGDLDPSGAVTGTLSVDASSTAQASVTEPEGYFGTIDAREVEEDDDFELTVTSGSDGDPLVLLLTLTDGRNTWETTTEIVLGEPLWTVLDPTGDPTGDALDDGFDFTGGWYRVVDGRVEMRVVSAVPYDLSTLFIEAWGHGTGDYSYHRWVLQSGNASMQGYTSGTGFVTIGDVEIDAPSDTELRMSWSVDEMGLSTDSFSIGWAAGWCGPDAYYCDHFPDGWGYGYHVIDTSGWFDVSW